MQEQKPLKEIRCPTVLRNKNGKTRICGKKLGLIRGKYAIVCPRCGRLCSGDTGEPEQNH